MVLSNFDLAIVSFPLTIWIPKILEYFIHLAIGQERKNRHQTGWSQSWERKKQKKIFWRQFLYSECFLCDHKSQLVNHKVCFSSVSVSVTSFVLVEHSTISPRCTVSLLSSPRCLLQEHSCESFYSILKTYDKRIIICVCFVYGSLALQKYYLSTSIQNPEDIVGNLRVFTGNFTFWLQLKCCTPSFWLFFLQI